MNYIFLDIDGVLNCSKSIQKIYNKYKNTPKVCLRMNFNEVAIKRLAKICKQNNAQIILSSTWRFLFDINTLEPQQECAEILLWYFNKYNIKLAGLLDFDKYTDRGQLIQNYVYKYLTNIDKFIIIDDEASRIINYFNNSYFIKVSHITGLLTKHIKIAKKLFKSQMYYL